MKTPVGRWTSPSKPLEERRFDVGGEHMGVSTVMGVPENGWFIREYATNMDDDMGVPLFQETFTCQ